MKKLFFIPLFFGFTISMSAQSAPKVGDELIIKSPTAQNFNHVSFPRLNILAKRGKVANYKSVYNNKVVVKDVITKDNGDTYVILNKKDGSKFFGYLKTIEANYSKAIRAKEIVASK